MLRFWSSRHPPASGGACDGKVDVKVSVAEDHGAGVEALEESRVERESEFFKDGEKVVCGTEYSATTSASNLRVALVHYTFAPVVGGVEKIMTEHAALIAGHGFRVRVVAGEGASPDDAIEFVRIPELHSACPESLAVQAGLLQGAELDSFNALADTLEHKLWSALHDCDVVMIHNIMTMHFNLAATHALVRIAERERAPRFISWVHDMAAASSKYPVQARRSVKPWSFVGQVHHRFEYVVISPQRHEEFCDVMGVAADCCEVVENGIHPFQCLQPPKHLEDFMIQIGAQRADTILFNCARLLPRKNIEYAISVTQELCAAGDNAILILTGAHDSHNASSKEYREKLKSLVADKGMKDRVHFVSDAFACSDADVAALYRMTDVYFHCSHDEGFGLPLLEAAMFRSKVFWPSSNPSLLESGVQIYHLTDDPKCVAQRVASAVQDCPQALARREVKARYSWERLFEQKLLPLLKRRR